MTEALASLLQISQIWLLAAGLVFLRIGAAFLVLPGFAEQYIPVRFRLGAALAVTAFLAPALADHLAPILADARQVPILMATEPISGLLLGLSVRFVIHAVQIAGTIAAQSTSLSQIAGGMTPDPQPAMSGLLMISALTFAMILGFHAHVVGMLMQSYDILPAGQFPLGSAVAGWGSARISAAFSLAFSLAAPFLLASVLYNLALGVINRAMPQLMVAMVGAPAITLGGLLLLFFSTPLLLPVWARMLQAVLADPMGPLP